MPEYNEIKFAEDIEYNVTFKFDTPQTGTGQYGEWNRYGVEHEGMESSFFASPGLHNRIKSFKQGDSVKIIKKAYNGKTSWDVKQIGGDSTINSSATLSPDARTKDIHRQVCLKLAVQSIGDKAKATDAYYKDIKNRMEGFIAILDPEDAIVEAVKEKFDGEEIPF